MPLNVDGPVAVNVHWPAVAVTPLSLMTVFVRVRTGCFSFLKIHVKSLPSANVDAGIVNVDPLKAEGTVAPVAPPMRQIADVTAQPALAFSVIVASAVIDET